MLLCFIPLKYKYYGITVVKLKLYSSVYIITQVLDPRFVAKCL